MPLSALNLNESCLNFALRRASRAVSQLFDKELAPLNLRSTQLNLLIGISEQKNKSLTEIAAHMVMDRTTLTRNLKPLEKAGLISNMALSDKRVRSYKLTLEGESLVQKALPLWQKCHTALEECLGEELLTTMIAQNDHLIQQCRHIV